MKTILVIDWLKVDSKGRLVTEKVYDQPLQKGVFVASVRLPYLDSGESIELIAFDGVIIQKELALNQRERDLCRRMAVNIAKRRG